MPPRHQRHRTYTYTERIYAAVTKFSFEVPLDHLRDFHDDQDYIFTLSMLYSDPRYQEYIRFVRNEGLKTIWLDNSFNELFEAETIHNLWPIAQQCNASKIVVPDSIDWTTQQLVESFVDAAECVCSDGVERTSTLLAVATDYNTALELIKYGAQQIAISYWVRNDWEYSQITALRQSGTPVHFLGLLDMPELIACKPQTCDTSMPIKLALQGKTLREWATEGYPHINTKDLGEAGQDFFDTKMTPVQIDLAKFNIEQLRSLPLD